MKQNLCAGVKAQVHLCLWMRLAQDQKMLRGHVIEDYVPFNLLDWFQMNHSPPFTGASSLSSQRSA
jgi:hypothetical protein